MSKYTTVFQLSKEMIIIYMNDAAKASLLKNAEVSDNYLEYCQINQKEPIINFFPIEQSSYTKNIDGQITDIKIIPGGDRVLIIAEIESQLLRERLAQKLKKNTGEIVNSSVPIEGLFDQLIHFYEYLLFHMPANIYWSGKDNRTLGCNKTTLKRLGIEKAEDFIGKTYADMALSLNWKLEEAQSFDADNLFVLENKTPIIAKEEVPIKDKDGNTVYYLTDRLPIENIRGSVIGVLGISHDVTKYKLLQKNLEAALELAQEADQKRKDFLENQEHDINTAVAGIQYAAMSIEYSDDIEFVKASVKDIVNCAERFQDYNRSLLRDLAWLENKGRVIEKRANLKRILSNLYDLNFLAAKHKQLSFTVEVIDDIPNFFIVDDLVLFQCLQNLVANAIKFTQSGTVNLTLKLLEKRGDEKLVLAFYVRDTVRGIAQSHQRYIFDEYFKVLPSNQMDTLTGEAADEDKGRGLGLTLSKKHAEAMGGELHLHWSELGRGSEFVLTLLLKPALNQIT